MKKKLFIGILFSSFFLYLALRGIDWDEFTAAFSQTNYWYLIPGVFFTMLGHFCRSIRWKFMMNPIKRIGIASLWSATAIAFMANNLFPARIGEFIRAFAIGRSEDVSKSASFATIVFERIVDVFVLIIFLWYCLVTIDGPDWLGRSAVLLIFFNVGLLALLVVMVRHRDAFLRFITRVSRPLPIRFQDRIGYSIEAFVNGLGVVTDIKAVLPIVLLSAVVWGSATLGVYYSLLALNLDVPLAASIFLIVAISLGSMVPSAPAFIGTMQYACVVALSVYGIAQSEALAYSTVYHATQFFPITIAGLYYAGRSHLRLSEIPHRS